MKILLYEYICLKCDKKFSAPGVSDFSYGEFVMFSEKGFNSAYLNAFSDVVYSELESLLNTIPEIKDMAENFQVDFFQKAFSITCDLAPDGGRFFIGKQPRCPACNCFKMKSWKPSDPPQYIDLPNVQHVEWEKLTIVDKRKKLVNFFTSFFKKI